MNDQNDTVSVNRPEWLKVNIFNPTTMKFTRSFFMFNYVSKLLMQQTIKFCPVTFVHSNTLNF